MQVFIWMFNLYCNKHECASEHLMIVVMLVGKYNMEHRTYKYRGYRTY